MKGIVLAGGNGTRLHPLTLGISKQLLPVYDKPAIYYPISILMLAGIREILIISTPRDLPIIASLLGCGDQFGVEFHYMEQKEANGIAEAFLIGKDFIGESTVSLILGDNFFYGRALQESLSQASQLKVGAQIFAHPVTDPERYGVVEFDKNLDVLSIEEKPSKPKSKWVATGLYFYDSQVVDFSRHLRPSTRGELEITDINMQYLRQKNLKVSLLGRGVAWLDTGTSDSLLETSQFVQTIESRQGYKIACLEEIALTKEFISQKQFCEAAERYSKSGYGEYLRYLATQIS